MDLYLMNKYYELSSKYPTLCFKFKLKDEKLKILNVFILGIVTNDGPICFKVDYSLYNVFNVRELYENYEFSSYIKGDINLPDVLKLENVSYFDINDDKLYNYFGNVEEVVIPDKVRVIMNNCFKNNNKIRYVKGDNVEQIYHYAFRNNSNLEKLEFKRTTTLSNLLNVPNLKEIIVGNNLSRIHIEDVISEKLKIVINNGINEHEYIFDCNLDKKFLEQTSAIIEDGGEISLAMINGNVRRYRFIKKDSYDHYNDDIVGICKFEKFFFELPDFLKQILQNYNYTFCVLKNFSYSGICLHDIKMLIFDMNNINISFFHEIGHAIDFCLEKISECDIFKKIFNEEKEFLYSNTNNRKMMFLYDRFFKHIVESEEEFFAESFQRYFEKDEYFYKECPKAYNFINNLMHQLNNNLNDVEVEQQSTLK